MTQPSELNVFVPLQNYNQSKIDNLVQQYSAIRTILSRNSQTGNELNLIEFSIKSVQFKLWIGPQDVTEAETLRSENSQLLNR